MDKKLEELVKNVITEELGEMVSKELELRFKPIRTQMDSMQNSQDLISKQLTEDRRDINSIKIDQAKIVKQGGVIIENQNIQEDKMVEAVSKEAGKIPAKVEKSVEKMFTKSSFLQKIKKRFSGDKKKVR